MPLYGLTPPLIAAACGVTLATARRWKVANRVPALALPLIALRIHGDLSALDGAWTGFTLRGDSLWTPEDARVTVADIRALPYLRAALAEHERARRLAAAAAAAHEAAGFRQTETLPQTPARGATLSLATHRLNTPRNSANPISPASPKTSAALIGSVAGGSP